MTPYAQLPDRNFWRKAVSEPDFGVTELYQKRFDIAPETRIATAGSCFAQHIGRALRGAGATFVDAEPVPAGLSDAAAARFGYGLYSARYGNVYSAAQLHQLVADARRGRVHKDAIWEKDGRWYDALRPGVEPDGLESPEEVTAHRRQHLARVKEMLAGTDLFIFTLGLTETWVHKRSGRAYPTCPGVIAGSFDPGVHVFRNADYTAVLRDLIAARRQLRRLNRKMRMLLTVSPVPLAATAEDAHVLTATTYSKSVLRAVAGAMTAEFPDVGYFPSYEIITGLPARGRWMEPDLRTVRPEGVAEVMRVFFAAHPEIAPAGGRAEPAATPNAVPLGNSADDLICEEELLEAFAR